MFKKSKLFYWVMQILAIFWLVALSYHIYKGIEIESWPSAKGVILSSSAKSLKNNIERFVLDIKYQYEVNNKKFQGRNISIMNPKFSRSETDEELNKYEKSTRVLVYYEPDNPANSYLIAGVPRWAYILWFSNLALLVFSLLNLIKLYKKVE